ncbi:hypothetical protein PtA15_6A247 [Puccinia triticina]|uniref:Lipoprotein n=1 Tax=Puccinia triticina TaxID=208348 RepID=A0ABY7CK57_9BASI|nr:uncharacterized protein PtA15_6A247 [Puccinia triticina]WAQ85619.1 hypothetical protein PtA15_6A247 [Puccinia triticina]WAR55498.1 hypothetical protein PtB15_6B239 [Puccinia triticina]
MNRLSLKVFSFPLTILKGCETSEKAAGEPGASDHPGTPFDSRSSTATHHRPAQQQ